MIRPNRIILIFFLLITLTEVFSQTKNPVGKGLAIRRAKAPIILDGKLDENDWKDADVAKDFFLNYPVDTASAPFQSEARLTFDDAALYVSFVCYDDARPDVVQSLRRDFDFGTNDNMGMYLGPYNDGLNGFYFQVTPYGVQAEGTISAGGSEDMSYNSTWDNKWYSKVTKHEDRWVAELMIPFKSFRFKSEAREWNITFLRWDLKRNLVSSWIATPIQFIPASFNYGGKLVWEDPAPHHLTNISLIPYVAGGTSTDKQTTPEKTTNDLQFGFDAKVGVTPSMNLDLTVNPDFSQVEVDRQVINLTRFEYQFPERRQFFLENSDLFERMGFPEARPFFSRRVGLARDTAGNLQKVPIRYGARLSGSLSKLWRLSVLNMQTKEQLTLGLPEQNFTVAAIQRNFWKQSNIQFSFTNKQSLGVNSFADSTKYFYKDLWRTKEQGDTSVRVLSDYNRTVTVDLESRSADSRWYTSMFYSHSFDNFTADKNSAGALFMQHTMRNYSFFGGTSFVQKNYNAEAGYVPSKGVYPGIANYFLSANATSYPKSKTIVTMGPQLDLQMSAIPSGVITDKTASAGYNFKFMNTATLVMTYNYIYSQLTNDFNPIDPDVYTNYLAGEKYSWTNVTIKYQSNQRSIFRYAFGTTKGGFYNGTNWNINGEFTLRYQPYGSFSMKFDYNDLDLPDNYGKTKVFVVSPRVDFTFTNKIFFTTFLQYNKYADNVNLNARFQWRYKPASDFFIVYTENYLPDNFASKNHSLVFKFTYWLNI